MNSQNNYEQSAEIKRLSSSFRKIDETVRNIREATGEESIKVLRKLTYFAYNLVCWLDSNNEENKENYLQKLNNFLKEAAFEVCEHGILLYSEEIMFMHQRYDTEDFKSVAPEYLNKKINLINKAKEKLTNMTYPVSEGDEEELFYYLNEIKCIYEYLHDKGQYLEKSKIDRMKNQKLNLKNIIITAIITTIITAVITAVITLNPPKIITVINNKTTLESYNKE